ncbi:MAG: hypothetical protein K6T68_12405, partial [Alicyclobacillus shizuokensis]|nr:hypothetical protein [Alicyclobacillus shizuokensis]
MLDALIVGVRAVDPVDGIIGLRNVGVEHGAIAYIGEGEPHHKSRVDGEGLTLVPGFVDTHVHFYDLQNPDLYYVWLQPGWKHPILGDIEAIQAQRYWADDFIAETRFANVAKSIHVQAALGIKDPVQETKWLQAFADRLGHPHGIVAEVHLAQPDAEEVINRHLEYPNMR